MNNERTLRTRRRAGALGCVVLMLGGGWFAPQAGATLVYTTGGFPTSPPKLPAPEAVWAAHNDGSSPRRLAAGSAPHVSPNGRLVLFLSFTHMTTKLAVVLAAGGKSRILLNHVGDVGTIAWSPDSKTIVTVSGTGTRTERLVAIDVASGRVRTLVSGSIFIGVSFSPQGCSLVYSLSGDLYTLNLCGSTHPMRIVSDDRGSRPVWGPTWIAFSRSRPSTRPNDAPKQDLYLIKPSGAGLHRLTHTNPGYLLSGLSPTAWSGDGRRLLAEFSGQDTSYAETVDPRTGRVRLVGTLAQSLIGWGLSRNGKSILATTGGPDPNDSDVVAVPYTGGGTPRVLARHAHYPSWNP